MNHESGISGTPPIIYINELTATRSAARSAPPQSGGASERGILMESQSVLFGVAYSLVLEMPGPERYQIFIRSIADQRKLWIVESESHVMTLWDADNRELLPVWPDRWFVEQSLSTADREAGYKPVPRSLETWLENTTPALISEGVMVGAFPNMKLECPIIDTVKFREHILKQIGQPQLLTTELRILKENSRKKIKRQNN